MIKFKDIKNHMQDWSFYRTPEVQAKYDLHLAKFTTEKKLDNHIIRYCLENKIANIVENAFPYDVEAKHYVLWYTNYIDELRASEMIREFVGDRRAYWGKSKKQSVPLYPHYHIFIKN